MAPSQLDQTAGGGEMPPDAEPKLGCFTSLNILTSIRTPSPNYICYPL
jgi:hypothetical protein